jgi:hypothetical protein
MTRVALVLAALSWTLAACSGEAGPPGPRGDPGVKGDHGPTTGTVTGTVTDAVAGDPLAAVLVAADDWGGALVATTTTGADGGFSLTLPAGTMRLSFTRTHYVPIESMDVGVLLARTVNVAVALSEAASGRPSVTLSAAGDDLGYGATAPLTATATDPNGDALAYTWENATSPALGAVTGSGPAGSITFPTMAQAFAPRPDPGDPGRLVSGYALEDRLGLVPIFGDTRGSVTARVTVDDGRGGTATASLTLHAASTVPGVRTVPVGTRVYLNSGHDGATAWTLATPAGSGAALDDAASRTPSFVVDRAGTFTVSEGGESLELHGGAWFGALGGGSGGEVTPDPTCVLCHMGAIAVDAFTPWKQTRHATVFARAIEGDRAFASACAGCHSVGFDPGTANSGFDDAAAAAGWTFPSDPSSGKWGAMWEAAPAVARLAGVQCESCHGPQSGYNVEGAHGATSVSNVNRPFISPRISFAAEACATCHGRGDYHVYSEWATRREDGAGHSSRDGARNGAGGTGLSPSCGRCHVAQGYTLYARLLAQGKIALNSVDATTMATITLANAEPVTCVACHDPHDATNPYQLRFSGDTPLLPAGFAGRGMGTGAVCLTCHNSRNGAQSGSDALTFLHEDGESYNGGDPTGYSVPHESSQGDVFAGRNAYFMGASLPMLSRHAAIEDTCAGCHMALQPATRLEGVTPVPQKHLFRIAADDVPLLCASCHPHVDGAGIQAQVEAELAALEAKLGLAAKAKLNALGTIKVRAHDAETDTYSSSSTSNSNVTIDLAANPIVAARIEPAYANHHGQVTLALTLTDPIAIPYPTPKTTAQFDVQLASLKDASSTLVYSLGGNFVRAGWNYFLVLLDGTSGLHNPSFVLGVLSETLGQDVSN